MNDVSTEQTRERLVYPFKKAPEPAEAITIAPGLLWLRMPMPGNLDHINIWLIDDEDGYIDIDTGLGNEPSRNVWRRIFTEVMGGKPLKRVIGTHLHPDHIGQAGWLCEHFDIPLYMSRAEYFQARTLVMDTGRDAPHEGVRFYHAAGFSDAQLSRYRENFGRFGANVFRMPQSYRRIVDSEILNMGGREWRVIMGSGHSPEHACFFCPELNVVISGDQILPRITSNVSVFPTEPDGNPLQFWLDSCAKLKAALPKDVLVLPAHHDPFHGVGARLDQLMRGHENGMTRILELCKTPKRAVDLFGALFIAKITDMNHLMATGESIAHINCLMARGQIARERDVHGVDWYRTIAA